MAWSLTGQLPITKSLFRDFFYYFLVHSILECMKCVAQRVLQLLSKSISLVLHVVAEIITGDSRGEGVHFWF